VFGAVSNGRRGIGIELKPSYYRQAVKNCEKAETRYQDMADKAAGLFDENK